MTDDLRVHSWHIAPREYARHEARRGRRYAYEALDPRRTALIVIDMVPFFASQSAYVRGVVPSINLLARRLRELGGRVVWVLPEMQDSPSPWAAEFFGPDVAATFNASGGHGLPHERLCSDLDAQRDDLYVQKSSPSAFFPARCPLPELLQAHGIENVLITGTVTNVCCESSARDAATLGFRVVMVADGCATTSDEVHNATLHTIYRSFGDVRPAAEVLKVLTAATGEGSK